MDSLTPVSLILAALLGAGALAGLARFQVRLAMIWAAAAILQIGIWVFCAALISRLPLVMTLEAWEAVSGLGTSSPWLMIDRLSWSTATVFLTLTTAGTLTALVRLSEYGWKDLAWLLLLTGLGLAGCFSNSVPAVMMAWAAIDIAGIVFLVLHPLPANRLSQHLTALVLNFLGIAALGIALSGWGGGRLDLSAIPAESTGFVLAAAGLRVVAAGFRPDASGRSAWGPVTALLWRMAPAASALTVLARVEDSSGGGIQVLLIPAAAASAAVVLAVRWLIEGRVKRTVRLWVGGLASLAVLASALGWPGAVAALAAALLLCGGLLFIPGPKRPGYRWLVVLAAGLVSGLPFTPSWEMAALIEADFWPWGFLFAVSYAALLAGFVIRGDGSETGEQPTVPGVRSIDIGGLILLVVGLVLSGWGPMLTGASPREGWWGGVLVVLLLFGWLRIRILAGERLRASIETSAWGAPAAWLRRLQRRGITAAGFTLGILARLLEGEAAMLWALVLLSLMVSLFVQLGLGS